MPIGSTIMRGPVTRWYANRMASAVNRFKNYSPSQTDMR
jgi:hypothetical protein